MLGYLTTAGHVSDGEVVRRERWNSRKRKRFANEVLNEMVDSGQVEIMYRDYKRTLELACSTKVGQRERFR